MTPEGMVPPTNRARIARIDLQVILMDFLNTHSKGEHCYAIPPSGAVLRQGTLPDDARVRWSRLDQDDTAREEALRAAREFVLAHSADDAALIAQIDAALGAPPARTLVVGIESASFDAVPLGGEPECAFDHLAYFPTKAEE